jgi:hypothetical protein
LALQQAPGRKVREKLDGVRLFRRGPPRFPLLTERLSRLGVGFGEQRGLEVIKKRRTSVSMPTPFFAYLRGNLGPIFPAVADQELRGRNPLAGFFFQGYL